jgi:hypothetical protein
MPISAMAEPLIEVGVIEQFDYDLVYIGFMPTGDMLLVEEEGLLIIGSWSDDNFTEIWNLDLNISINTVSVDFNGGFIALGVNSGIYFVNTNVQNISGFIETSLPVQSLAWDIDGDLWVGHHGGNQRRAVEYDTNGVTGSETGITTVGHGSAMTTLAILSNGQIVTGGNDLIVKIQLPNGVVVKEHTALTSAPTQMIVDSKDRVIVGLSNGRVYRFNTTDDHNSEYIAISSSQAVNSLALDKNENILVGTSNGRLHVISEEDFSEKSSHSTNSRVIFSWQGDGEKLYAVTQFSSTVKIRLFDLDSDEDGVADSADAFPMDPTQTTDSDGDGYGDYQSGNNSDAFPNNANEWLDTDGDLIGDNSDIFPNNSDQWIDSDGDGYGDNSNGEDGDVFPEDNTQWFDSDKDSFGDNLNGTEGDACPHQNGFSTIDRYGCPDSDLDAYSDGGDSFPYDKTQWIDADSDGFGDELWGYHGDQCSWEWGNSTKSWLPILNDEQQLVYQEAPYHGCIDSDGDGWTDGDGKTFGDQLPNNPTGYRDTDGDGVDDRFDYSPSDEYIQTEQDYCIEFTEDNSEKCQGWRNPAYQKYLTDRAEDSGAVKPYFIWNQQDDLQDGVSSSIDMTRVVEAVTVGGAAFLAIVVLLLIGASMSKRKKHKSLIEKFGVPFDPTQSVAEEALEGKAGSSSFGGIDSDDNWDDEVAPLDISEDKVHLSDEDVVDIIPEMDYEDGLSIEDLAGKQPVSDVDDMDAEKLPDTEPTASAGPPSQAAEPESPPVPEAGLPEGWTMEQWKWYGAQWLETNG